MPARENPALAVLARRRAEARVLEAYGEERLARTIRELADEIEDALRRAPRDWISTEEAVRWSGYSRDHLQALARDGKVDAERRRGEWYFARGSLPRKPGEARETAFDPPEGEGADPVERAARRALRGR